ncbi:MAG: ABC transporter ATP-binding protein [Syntrophomonadaceae bacterium]|jgi:putative ABC transport system ATP-binding protein|nr:ABC transporter ATP-binding protein [Syntrophomonadaceae bacterium]
MDKTSKIFELHQVSRIYQMGEVEVRALEDVELDIYQGEFTVILGPSGSGKSTLLNLLGGLDRPTRGRIQFQGQEITACSDDELTTFRRDNIGFVFQFFNLVPTLTARENVELATAIAGKPGDARHYLKLVGLVHRSDSFPSQLSGGEQQRVAIARALVKEPQIILCDEPTGALDYETGVMVLRVLYDINRQMGHNVMVITHNAAIAAMADRVIYLHSGRIDRIEDNPHPVTPEEVSW